MTHAELDYVVSVIGGWIGRQGIPTVQSAQTETIQPLLWEPGN